LIEGGEDNPFPDGVLSLPRGAPAWTCGEIRDLVGRRFDQMRRQQLLNPLSGQAERPEFSPEGTCPIFERHETAADVCKGFWKAGSLDTVFVDLVRRWLESRQPVPPSDDEIKLFMHDSFDTVLLC
jgi:hypothetical protein